MFRRPLADAMTALAADGFVCQVAMIDGQLVMPTAAIPSNFVEVRLRTPAGMVTLRRQDPELELSVFGNASDELLAARDRIAAAIAG